MRTSILVTGSVAALLMLSACRNQADPNEIAVQGKPQDPNLSVQASGYHGNHFSGPVYLPRFSPMEGGTTAYNVTYQDGVTVISKGDTMHHLVAIRQDGTYVFDSSSSQIANLKPGGVLLLSGLALCTVVDVQRHRNGYSVKTGPAKITDAIKEGRLEGTYKIDFSRMQAAQGFIQSLAGYRECRAADLMLTLRVTITTSNSLLTMTTSTFKRPLNSEAARERWPMKESVTSATLFPPSGCRSQTVKSRTSTLPIPSSLAGRAEVVCGRERGCEAGVHGQDHFLAGGALEECPLSKAAYHVPILLGPVPFDLRISLGFSFIPAFTSKNSVVEGSKLIKYSGTGGFSFRMATPGLPEPSMPR